MSKSNRVTSSFASLFPLASVVALAACSSQQPLSVSTQHYDNERSGANLQETYLSPATTGWENFGLLGRTSDLLGKIYAQPLYMSNLSVAGVGTRNVVIVVTDAGRIAYFDADNPSDEMMPIQSADIDTRILELYATPVIDPVEGVIYFVYKHFRDYGSACGSSQLQTFPDDAYLCGSTSCSNAADTCMQRPDFYTQYCDECYEFKIKKLRLRDLSEAGSLVFAGVDAPTIQCSRGGEVLSLRPVNQSARSSLLLSRNTVYAAFGAVPALEGVPNYSYHGWVVAFDTRTLAVKGVFCTTPHSPENGGALVGRKSGGGIWQSGNGLAADDDGNLYFQTGNGMYSNDVLGPKPTRPGDSFENSFIKLRSLPAHGSEWLPSDVLGVFTPGNIDAASTANPVESYKNSYQELERSDLDLGSSGPVLLPGGTLVGGGKYGRFHHLGRGNLNEIQEFQAFQNTWDDQWEDETAMCSTVDCSNSNSFCCILGKADSAPNIHGGPIYWKGPTGGYVYAWAEKDYLKAYRYDLASGTFAAGGGQPLTGPVRVLDHSMPGGALSISARGSSGGVLWATIPEPFGQCDTAGNLWLSSSTDEPKNCDALENYIPGRFFAFDATTLEVLFEDKAILKYQRFASPVVANGKVFVPLMNDDVHDSGHTRLNVYGFRRSLLDPDSPALADYRPGDVNGDGKDDLIARDAYGYLSIWTSDGSTLSYSDGVYGQTPACPGPYCPAGLSASVTGNGTGQPAPYNDETRGFSWNRSNRFTTIDLNGDGKSDMLARQGDGRVDVWISDGRNLAYVTTENETTTYDDAAGYDSGERFQVGHFDHSPGEQWLVRQPTGTWDIWSWTGSGLKQLSSFQSDYSDAQLPGGNRFFVMDLDGNGLDDILVRNPNGVFDVWSPTGEGSQLTLTRSYGFPSQYQDNLDGPAGWNAGARFWTLKQGGKGALLARWPDGTFDLNVPSTQITPSDCVGGCTDGQARWGFVPAAPPSLRFRPSVDGKFCSDSNGWNDTRRVFQADIDGDGSSDLLFRLSDGRVALWRWSGAQFVWSRDISTRFNDDAGWSRGIRFL